MTCATLSMDSNDRYNQLQIIPYFHLPLLIKRFHYDPRGWGKCREPSRGFAPSREHLLEEELDDDGL